MKKHFKPWRLEALVSLIWLLPMLLPYGYGLWALYRDQRIGWWILGMLALSFLLALISSLTRNRNHGIEFQQPPLNAAEAEQRARKALGQLMKELRPEDITSAKAVERLLRSVLEIVAEAWNPGRRRAELRFTVPEALALVETLAHRLRIAVRQDLPALQHIQISHAVFIHEHAKPMQKMWNVYRVGRIAFNPVGSVISELRREVMQSLTPMVNDAIRIKAAALLVRETGEAAMLLYSGHLRQEPETDNSTHPAMPEESIQAPLTLMVTGQPNVGKSSLINALSGQDRAVVSPLPCEANFTAYALEEETAGDLILVEGPGLKSDPGKDWFRQVQKSDVLLWVMAAHRADRARDQRGIRHMRDHYRKYVRERPPPILLVLTHVDRLDPAREWDPPYDPSEGSRPKERSMREAATAAAAALDLPITQVVAVMCDQPESAWNLGEFWQTLQETLPEARQVRLGRLANKRSQLDGVSDLARTLPGLLRSVRKTFR